ncbi:hypothetical protein Bca52824_078151 [Brassica carinata]|uniref:Uncharacterized protein n=1 Tax=Brassica carinata TaxID=52824 RepID=A0A8X7TY87_BRACI|nr:hypothetical protein Bca52824_078151 [Brassica carinata]
MNVEKLLESERFYNLFQILMNKISGPVLILGSRDISVCVSMFDALALACHNIYESYRSEPKIVVATSINPTLLIASRNVFRRKNASLMFNKGRWSCFRLMNNA